LPFAPLTRGLRVNPDQLRLYGRHDMDARNRSVHDGVCSFQQTSLVPTTSQRNCRTTNAASSAAVPNGARAGSQSCLKRRCRNLVRIVDDQFYSNIHTISRFCRIRVLADKLYGRVDCGENILGTLRASAAEIAMNRLDTGKCLWSISKFHVMPWRFQNASTSASETSSP